MTTDPFYEAVHVRPDGPTTLSRWIRTAVEYGYDGLVVRNHGDEGRPPELADAGPGSDVADSARHGEAAGGAFDVVDGVEVRASEPGRASGFVGSHRERATVVVVHGGAPAINRFAVHQPAVDVLAHPMRSEDAFDHVLARAAADNGVRVEVSLRQVLGRRGGDRVRAIRRLRKLRDLVRAYDVPHVVSGDPHDHLDLRSPRELRALGDVVGLSAEWIDEGLREWGRLAGRNRARRSDRFVEPGVWRVGDAEES